MILLPLLLALGSLSLSSAFRQLSPFKNRKFFTIRQAIDPISQDVLSSCAALGGSIAWLQIWITLAKEGKIDPRLSRKIIHCGSGPLFILLWPLYSSNEITSRAIAASIPFIQLTRLYLAGTKSDKVSAAAVRTTDDTYAPETVTNDLVNAISRSGSKSEALGGPLLYTVVLFLGTLLSFRSSPVGVVAICQMAAGDGIADIVGRRFGTVKWPFSEKKSLVGSAAFVVGAFTVCSSLLYYLSATGALIGFDVATKLPQLLLISVLCALVELIPIGDDNISVPVAGTLLSWALL